MGYKPDRDRTDLGLRGLFVGAAVAADRSLAVRTEDLLLSHVGRFPTDGTWLAPAGLPAHHGLTAHHGARGVRREIIVVQIPRNKTIDIF